MVQRWQQRRGISELCNNTIDLRSSSSGISSFPPPTFPSRSTSPIFWTWWNRSHFCSMMMVVRRVSHRASLSAVVCRFILSFYDLLLNRDCNLTYFLFIVCCKLHLMGWVGWKFGKCHLLLALTYVPYSQFMLDTHVLMEEKKIYFKGLEGEWCRTFSRAQ